MTFKRRLGKSNIEVSALGLGCYAAGGTFNVTVENGEVRPWGWSGVDDAESIRAIQCAIDLGVNFFDTAMAYGCGHSERILGEAVQDRRDQVVIATKFGKLIDEEQRVVSDRSATPEQVRELCEASLRRLNSDYIDLYQIHESTRPIQDVPAIVNVLEELVSEGKIRHYGWSTDDPERVRALAQYPNCVAVQQRMHALAAREEIDAVLAVCDERDLASINRSPLVMGILTGKFNAASTFEEDDVRHSLGFDFKQDRFAGLLDRANDIRDVLTSDGRTAAQGALGWIWAYHDRTIPIPGFKSMKQVEENAKAMDFGPLNSVQMRQIDTILNREHASAT